MRRQGSFINVHHWLWKFMAVGKVICDVYQDKWDCLLIDYAALAFCLPICCCCFCFCWLFCRYVPYYFRLLLFMVIAFPMHYTISCCCRCWWWWRLQCILRFTVAAAVYGDSAPGFGLYICCCCFHCSAHVFGLYIWFCCCNLWCFHVFCLSMFNSSCSFCWLVC